MITDTKNREALSRCVCLFLAEMLRTRKVSLSRAADIAAVTLMEFDKIFSEAEFLEAIRRLEFEFQEIKYLEQDVLLFSQISERERMEHLVKEFVIKKLPTDPKLPLDIMQQALVSGSTLESLSRRFSDFALFVSENQ